MSTRITRLAPSPTGALHLGNARTFLINWAMARNNGWRLLMRIEDLDGPRVKAGAVRQALEMFSWLGIDFDGTALRQSDDLEPYRDAMRRLAGAGLIFACNVTRKEIRQAASAPHGEEQEIRFHAELRPTSPDVFRFDGEETNYRLLTPDETVLIEDGFAGRTLHCPHREVGDFVIWTRRGVPAYQLAVVVDDARQGVTDVVRGDDLLPSAARQSLIYRALGCEPPGFWHLPLVIGEDGKRLAKRHGDTRLERYRAEGVSPQRVIGLLAHWCGLCNDRQQWTAEDFRSAFSLDSVPRTPVTFTEEDHRWLTAGRC
ncbi:MAG: hypothetical protein JSV91_09550 [Phycisphaerales bacterium]|nr:MAG: hypothetical protein JSV91_09550 [Phycisphaerales bacterium]